MQSTARTIEVAMARNSCCLPRFGTLQSTSYSLGLSLELLIRLHRQYKSSLNSTKNQVCFEIDFFSSLKLKKNRVTLDISKIKYDAIDKN